VEDTIVALATAVGEASIHVLRLSGPQAEDIVDKIFVPRNLKRWQERKGYTLYLGKICDGDQVLDEVLVSRMYAPSSFTGEDVLEISCHGGILVARRILELCLRHGARLAEPGEFTKRAFLNGKLDLVQAEAVIDLITAKTDLAADLALDQLSGVVSERINEIRKRILEVLAFIEARIDFPEDVVEELNRMELKARIEAVRNSLEHLLQGTKTGKVIREGLHTVIAGRPNVGKSSLLNALLKEERAIVTDVPGTTRDEIHESLNMGGILLHLVDTAGIRHSDDVVEQIGIRRAWENLKRADLIILVTEAGAPLTDEERAIITDYGERVIVLANKVDLVAESSTVAEIERQGWIPFSVAKNIGFDRLEQAIVQRVFAGQAPRRGEPLLSNVRQIQALERGFQSLNAALAALDQGMPWDIMSIDIRAALQAVSEITGHDVQESLIEDIFSRFCIGK